MRKVDANTYSKARPKIVQDDIGSGDFVVVTIAGFDEAPGTDDAGHKKVTPFLLTKEYGDKVLWLNKTQIGHLIERLGDDAEHWNGKRVPIIKYTALFGGDRYPKVVIPDPEEWDDLLAMGETGESAKKKARKLTPAKRGKK